MLYDPAKSVPCKPRTDGPTYRLRVPVVVDRASYRRAIQGVGARFWPNLPFVRLCRSELERLLTGDDQIEARAAGTALIDAYAERLNAAIDAWQLERNDETDAEFAAALPFPDALAALINELGRCSPQVALAAGDNVVYRLLRGIEAARLLLVGWDRAEPFRRDLDGPSEATLALIPNEDFEAIGLKVDELVEPGEARLGNSGSRSSGSPEATASSADGTTTPPTPPSAVTTASA
ncbi:MAG: hypothetical protein WAS21_10490 [Geminicoccaceae bacterium]